MARTGWRQGAKSWGLVIDMKEPHLILGIGELLWDMLPEGPRLGGAPANFAVMAGRLGDHAAILSRIGRDEMGREAIDRLDPMPVDTSHLEVDPGHQTGQVTVSLSAGEPNYIIHQPAAWDFMELTDDWIQLAERADAICFGSLAQRSQQSRQTIQTLAAETSATCIRIFDVNLRAPFYSSEVLQESLELSTVVKMNEAEAPLVLELLDMDLDGVSASDGPRPGAELMRSTAEQLLQAFPTLQLVAVTRGSRGSLLATRDEWDEHTGFPVKLADGVGAGDAFTAAIAHYLLRGAGLATLNEAGNRWGGWMASQSGAMPALPGPVREAIAAAIEKAAN
ncbi:MAG: carbohydrate kinase [Terracidiphilus sp.]